MTVLFSIVNFRFIRSNIPTPAYGDYILQICVIQGLVPRNSDFLGFLDRAQLLTQKLLKKGYVAPRLKSSLHKFYGRHHELFDRYEISISQMTMDMFPFYVDVKYPFLK
jgi:hypothetical protein